MRTLAGHTIFKKSERKLLVEHTYYMLQKIYSTQKNKLGVYHALVSSHLNYGISVWGDPKTNYIKKIETIQRKATRSIVNGKYNAHINPIFKKLKILKIKDMVDQGRVNIMFAINKKEAPIGTQKLFKKQIHQID